MKINFKGLLKKVFTKKNMKAALLYVAEYLYKKKAKKAATTALMLLMLAAPAAAEVELTLCTGYDLDGVNTVTDDIVALVDLTNVAFTIAAQPDVPKQFTATIVDTTPSITVGTLTFVGVDHNGAAATEAVDISGGAGTYTTDTYWDSITSITASAVATLGGSSDETIKVGSDVTDLVAYPYTYTGANNIRGGWTQRLVPIVTSGTVDDLEAATAATEPFQGLGVYDLLRMIYLGQWYDRYILTYTDTDNVAVNEAVNLGTTGVNFMFRKFSAYPYADEAGWISISGLKDPTFHLIVDKNTSNSGVDYQLECRHAWPYATPAILIGPTTVASAATASVPLYPTVGTRWGQCRVGVFFHDYDDADAAAAQEESITITFTAGE